MAEAKYKTGTANMVTVTLDGHSWGMFCYTPEGDLFLNSDWGFYAFSWRSMGEGTTVEEFLCGLGKDYLLGKFELNTVYQGGKKIPKERGEHIWALFEAFKNHLKSN